MARRDPTNSGTPLRDTVGMGTLVSGRLLTPSKITAWLDCAHYLTLRGLADAGALQPTNEGIGSFARLLMDRGVAHEHAYRDALIAEGVDVVELSGREPGESFADHTVRVGGVLAEGHDVVYQMPFVHDGMRGIADFMLKVDTPSALGPFSYEPVDAKLARAAAKPGHVLQLCFYADALEAVQGVRPERVHLYLGSGVTESVRLRDVDAYWRRIRVQLARVMTRALRADPSPGRAPEGCGRGRVASLRGDCRRGKRRRGGRPPRPTAGARPGRHVPRL